MNINPGIHVEKTEIINKLLEEVDRFIEELEQQVREDLHNLNTCESESTQPIQHPLSQWDVVVPNR